MKRFFLSILCFFFCTQSNAAALSPVQIATFYEEYICQTKQILSVTGLTTPCISDSLPTPPPNPSAPPFKDGLLPIVLVNNSGLSDFNVFILVTGHDENNPQTQSFISFNALGIGTRVDATSGDNGSNYSRSLATLPESPDGYVVYIPKISDATIWFSMYRKLNMPVNAQNQIVQPDFTNRTDPNYFTVYDTFELAYVSSGVQVVANATAVNFFGIPLYGYLSTPAPGSLSNTGLFNSRYGILYDTYNLFSLAPRPANTQWQQLFLEASSVNGGSFTLRILSPGAAMPIIGNLGNNRFDPNYLDNRAVYNYSYLQDIWTGTSSFYRQNPLVITIPNGSQETYTGVINANNTITFTSTPSGYQVVFSAPTTTLPLTTSREIFSGLFFIQSDNSPGAADGILLNRLFEEAIITGLAPTKNTLSESYLQNNQTNFYTINPFLSKIGQNSGPWYDLYSKGLHNQGFIYTYAFDEFLWPQVQISSQTLVPNETYLGITIANVGNIT